MSTPRRRHASWSDPPPRRSLSVDETAPHAPVHSTPVHSAPGAEARTTDPSQHAVDPLGPTPIGWGQSTWESGPFDAGELAARPALVEPEPEPEATPADVVEPDTGAGLTTNGGEPVLIEKAVTLTLAALVGLGWITIPDTSVMAIASAVAALASLLASVLVRARVTPNPSGAQGLPEYVQTLVHAELHRDRAQRAARRR